jgi:heme exporter protein A
LCAGLLPIIRAAAACSDLDPCHPARRIAARVGLLGHRNGLYRDHRPRTSKFWGATVDASDEEVSAAMKRLGVDGRLRDVLVGKLGGQARRTAGLHRRPPQNCGCSTSRTPDST